jgi:hypothetical protein
VEALSLKFRGTAEVAPEPAPSPAARMRNAFTEFMCAHEDMTTTDGHRMFLRCRKCLRETPGWLVK